MSLRKLSENLKFFWSRIVVEYRQHFPRCHSHRHIQRLNPDIIHCHIVNLGDFRKPKGLRMLLMISLELPKRIYSLESIVRMMRKRYMRHRDKSKTMELSKDAISYFRLWFNFNIQLLTRIFNYYVHLIHSLPFIHCLSTALLRQ